MTQTERVILAAKSFRGVSQVDFLGPDTVDGKPPITRLAARIFDAERKGHVFEIIGWRQSCKVYRWIEGPGVEGGAGSWENGAPSDPADSSPGPSLALSSGVERGTGHAHVAQDHVGVSPAGVALSPGRLFEVGETVSGHYEDAA